MSTTQTRYTPGPWLIHPFVDSEYSIFNQMGTAHIADATTEQDAKLIAAAPELLEAAKIALGSLLSTEPGYIELKNAINKATL